ncbi:hypothetical protein AURDEDRAFT_171083 [Auricularia subglabra TFB-10046 SS5]|nr:hypothetical protein AURDEDRAFT_171083 [Auricularia subglabra TFB-10046 SS5]
MTEHGRLQVTKGQFELDSTTRIFIWQGLSMTHRPDQPLPVILQDPAPLVPVVELAKKHVHFDIEKKTPPTAEWVSDSPNECSSADQPKVPPPQNRPRQLRARPKSPDRRRESAGADDVWLEVEESSTPSPGATKVLRGRRKSAPERGVKSGGHSNQGSSRGGLKDLSVARRTSAPERAVKAGVGGHPDEPRRKSAPERLISGVGGGPDVTLRKTWVYGTCIHFFSLRGASALAAVPRNIVVEGSDHVFTYNYVDEPDHCVWVTQDGKWTKVEGGHKSRELVDDEGNEMYLRVFTQSGSAHSLSSWVKGKSYQKYISTGVR